MYNWTDSDFMIGIHLTIRGLIIIIVTLFIYLF